MDHLSETGADDRLDRLVRHPAFAGPEVTFMGACLAGQRDDLARAHTLIRECLEELPGSYDFLAYANEIGADLPSRARTVVGERTRWEARIPAQALRPSHETGRRVCS